MNNNIQITRLEIARINEQWHVGGGGGIAMVIIGLIFIVLAILAETSAVRLAAWGAIWTGWNVLALMAHASGVRRTYVVTRDAGQEP